MPEAPRSNAFMYVLAVLLLAALGGGAWYLTRSSSTPSPKAQTAAPVSIVVESTPPGASITLGGEPTGLKTPATLTGLSGAKASIGLVLDGYVRRIENVDVPASGTVTKRFRLEPEQK